MILSGVVLDSQIFGHVFYSGEGATREDDRRCSPTFVCVFLFLFRIGVPGGLILVNLIYLFFLLSLFK